MPPVPLSKSECDHLIAYISSVNKVGDVTLEELVFATKSMIKANELFASYYMRIVRETKINEDIIEDETLTFCNGKRSAAVSDLNIGLFEQLVNIREIRNLLRTTLAQKYSVINAVILLHTLNRQLTNFYEMYKQ